MTVISFAINPVAVGKLCVGISSVQVCRRGSVPSFSFPTAVVQGLSGRTDIAIVFRFVHEPHS